MATMNFNTANQTYRQLMGNGLIYTVPRFQRDYSWTEEEWDDLWRDIQAINEPETDTAHYMGFLVLQSKDNKNFDVIDGQQRLTTMSILILTVLAHLKKLVDNNVDSENNLKREEQLRNAFIGYLDPVTLIPRSKLSLNRNNNTLYQNYLIPLQEVPRRNLKATEHLMRKAYVWFYDRVGEMLQGAADGVALATLVERLSDTLFFTVITVTDELNAYKVFETLNARGVKLSSTDLLKNYLFSVVHNDTKEERELNYLDDRWESLVSKLGSESFPDFLRTHWNSRSKFVRHSDLFKRIREKIRNKQNVFDLVRELERDADIYAALPNPEDILWTTEQKVSVSELKMFGIRQIYPMLLSAYRKFGQDDITTLLRISSVMTFRFNVIGGLSTGEQERIYNSIAEKITAGTIDNMNSVIQELRPIYASDEQFKSAFSEKQIKTTQARNKRIMRYILFKIEKHLSGHVFDLESPQYNIEHILPENPGDGWDNVSDRDHEQFVYRLGNMTLMNAAANRDIANKSFSDKKPFFEDSEFVITQKVATDNSDWNSERIASRQRWMANQAISIWRVAQLSS